MWLIGQQKYVINKEEDSNFFFFLVINDYNCVINKLLIFEEFRRLSQRSNFMLVCIKNYNSE